ncbi:ATP-binding cassette domain-containing protein [Ramlibacter sp. MAHUQ-53]|uniref:ATP-binding cassette domain-containing protein n=1 Tax=unclassified Ramlibacter TaxID=2617605 RepID=UPI00362E131E
MSSDASASASPSPNAIEVRGVGKTFRIYDKPHHRLLQTLWRGRRSWYREFQALQDVSFDLARGETLGIIGRNGAGKSTLLQVICGTLTPTAGEARVHGRVAALLELGAGFNPEFTGRENAAINASILGLSPQEVEARMDDIIRFADIGEFIDQPVKTYSSGMYVRLAFAVVIHVEPDILIVDEALAVGDALFQAKCMTRMRRMLDDGLTLVFISHDVAAVKALCRKALWLDHGRVRALGDTAEVTRLYSEDWIREANAAQGVAVAEAEAATGAEEGMPAPAAVGTGAVRLTAMAWGTGASLQREALADWGDTLRIRARVVVRQPCEQLVVSFHVKNRQNQHVVGGHTGHRPEVYGRRWQPGEVVDVEFTTPVQWHDGAYTLTMLAASMGDVQHYSDAVFHDWADDVAALSVTRRAVFPLSDLVEPPAQVRVSPAPRWLVLDDFFPNLLTGFRVAEYNAHLDRFPQLAVLSSLGDFEAQHARYAARYPQHAQRVRAFEPQLLAGAQLAYLNFLNNAAQYLPHLERAGLPFVLTLYPGGGLGLDEPESDAKLLQVLSSPRLAGLVFTQPVTRDYVQAFAQRHGLTLPPSTFVPGVVVNPLYFDAPAHGPYFGAGKATLDICFVAEKYMPQGLNKGYPEFIAAAHALADVPNLRFSVVGSFTADDLDVSALGDRIRFLGRLETGELPAFFAAQDLVVSPNRPHLLHPGNFDGFPTGACVEAALCGVAVMATDALGQNPGFVDGESLLLLPAGEPAQIVAAIVSGVRALVADPARLAPLAAAGREATRRWYDPQAQIAPRQQALEAAAGRLGLPV